MNEFTLVGFVDSNKELDFVVAFPNRFGGEPLKPLLASVVHSPEEWEHDGWNPA